MLEFPITSKPFYLLDPKEPFYFNKPDKAKLTKDLLSMLDKTDIVTSDDDLPTSIPHVHSDAIIIDFMAYLRKLTSVKLSNVTTFGSLCRTLLRNFQSYSNESGEIRVIMENYKYNDSIKAAERRRRQKMIGSLCRVLSDEQPLPKMDDFFNKQENKVSLQHYFVNYCFRNYTSSMPLYIAGGLDC